MIETKGNMDSITFDRNDIAAVANSRFFKKTGLKILMIWAVVMLGTVSITNLTGWLPIWLSYFILSASAIVFVYIYSKKQTEVRVRLWERLEQDRIAKQKQA
jgi:putative flippase GtrA